MKRRWISKGKDGEKFEITTEKLLISYEEDKIINREVNEEIDHENSFEENIIDYADRLGHKNQLMPQTYQETMTDKAAWKWISAIEDEYKCLLKNNTWEWTELPEQRKPVKCKWVYIIKWNEKGKPIRYKARLVAKG